MALDYPPGAEPPADTGLLDAVMGAEKQDQVPRDPPDVTDQRAALVSAWCRRVKSAKEHWKKSYDRMLDDQDFTIGRQWSKSLDDRRYVANLVLRLVSQKTAFLYAKNPKAVARKRERLNATVWDGTQEQLQGIVQTGTMMMQGMGPPGMPPVPGAPPMGGPPAAMGAPPPMGPPGMPPPGMGHNGPPPGPMPMTPPGMPPPSAVPPLPGSLPGQMPMPPAGGIGGGGIAGIMGLNPMAAAAAQPMIDIAMDAARVKAENEMLDKLGRTLELLYGYEVSEQVRPFKSMMKLVVRRTITCGVGYVKLGFERVMEQRPDLQKGIADASERLATLERLGADIADEMVDADSQEAEQLKLMLTDMKDQVEFVAREGLTFDYPLSNNIIPDEKTISLRHWLGSDWVCEQFILSPAEVQEIYGVDVGKAYTTYNRADMKGPDPVAMAREWAAGSVNEGGRSWEDRNCSFCCVWEIYCRKDGLVYVVCDGFKDFLREPASPEIYNERFYPWYALVFNECDHESEIFPPSDVRIIRDMQLEYNRCREGLKEHRIAARPFTAVVGGTMDEEDFKKLENRNANDVIEFNALQPQQDIKQLLQPFSGPGVDQTLYEVNQVYEDILRTTGIQEANLGGTSDATATQAQIAEGSRQTSMGSNIDDLNDLLTALARNGGQILLTEVSKPTVEKIVGPGCVWPEISRQDVSQEVLLEIEAGSMGRPNAAQDVATAQRIYPLLIQIPGINPEFLAKDLLRRMDDRLDLTQAFKSMVPSIVAMNSMAQAQPPGTGPVAGGAQGPAGANNGPGSPGAAPGGPPDAAGQLGGVPPPGASGAAPSPIGP